MKRMYYLVYQTTNHINNKKYIGMHVTKDPSDGYLGSGKLLKAAIKKYGKENFSREILHECEDADEMQRREAELVTEDFCAQDDNYNLCPGGRGGFGYINANDLGGFAGRTHNDEAKARISQASTGRLHTAETKEKIRLSNDRTNESRGKKISQALRGRAKKRGPNKAPIILSDAEKLRRVELMRHARTFKTSPSIDQKQKILNSLKEAWDNGKRKRRYINWNAVQFDFDSGMSRQELFDKYAITRNHLRDAKKAGKFVGSYK